MEDFKITPCDGWADLRISLLKYAKLSRERRNEFWFRGQGHSDWALTTTLDRFRKFTSAETRQELNLDLLREFKNQAVHVGIPEGRVSGESRLELLARHHGLPSPLMDWTLSPYVATYFAYAEMNDDAESVSVWCMDLNKIDWSSREDVDILGDDLPLFDNRRALQQRSAFLRISTPARLESLIPQALRRYDLPARDRLQALQDLDEMLVNATSMFYDLEGAATTTVLRLSGSKKWQQ